MDSSIKLAEVSGKKKKWINRISSFLTLLLFLKIAGFFTISENINVTRVIKVFLRMSSNLGVVGLFIYITQKGYVHSVRHKNLLAPLLYIAYLLMGLSSLIWSTNTVFSTLQLFMTSESLFFVYLFMTIILLINKEHPSHPIRLSNIYTSSIFYMILIFVIGKYIDPDKFFRLTHGGEVARLGGFMMNPNELGMLAVVGMSTALVEFVNKQKRFKVCLFFAVMLYGLLLTSSRSSLGSFVVVAGLFTLLYAPWNLKFAIFVGAILLFPVAVQNIILKQGDLQEVLSMTGRIPFWHALITEGLPLEPWKGFGFMRIAYGDYFSSVHTYAAKMTHNTFIQVLMNLGFIGFGIAMAQMALTFRAFLKSKVALDKLFFVVVFIPIFINSLTEFGIWGENNFGILFYQFLIFLFVLEYNPYLSFKEKILRQRLTD